MLTVRARATPGNIMLTAGRFGRLHSTEPDRYPLPCRLRLVMHAFVVMEARRTFFSFRNIEGKLSKDAVTAQPKRQSFTMLSPSAAHLSCHCHNAKSASRSVRPGPFLVLIQNVRFHRFSTGVLRVSLTADGAGTRHHQTY